MATKSTKAAAKTQATKPEPEAKPAEATKPKTPTATPAFTGEDGKAVQGQTAVFKLVDGELGERGPEGGQQFEFVALYPVAQAAAARDAAIKAADVSAEDVLLTADARFTSKID